MIRRPGRASGFLELGTAALNNGCNAALVIESFRAIRLPAFGLPTIRFALFTGEERGPGLVSYVLAIVELDNVVAC